MASRTSSAVSYVANGVASAATYTVGAVPVLLTGTAAVAGAAGSAVAGAVSQSGHVLKHAGTAACGAVKVTGGAAAGTVVASTVGSVALKLVGFTAIGPAPGSYAAVWMSSAAIANGGAVAAGSLYSTVQAVSMGGGMLLGAPAVLTVGAVAGAGVAVWTALRPRI